MSACAALDAYPRMIRYATPRTVPDAARDAVHDAICELLARGIGIEDSRFVRYAFIRIRRACLEQTRRLARQRYLESSSSAFLGRAEGNYWDAFDWIEERSPAARIARRNAAKAACPRGHAYTDDNTYRRPNGSRVCKLCRRLASARLRAERAQARDVCARGHARSAETTRYDRRGRRLCVLCLTAAKPRRGAICGRT